MGKNNHAWRTGLLGDLFSTTSGGTPSRKEPSYYVNGSIPWVKSGELEFGVITETEEYITQAGLENSSAKIFTKGTLLIALYGATIGKLSFWELMPPRIRLFVVFLRMA